MKRIRHSRIRHSRIQRAIMLFKRGDPLPIDLFAALLYMGVDVDELYRIHG